MRTFVLVVILGLGVSGCDEKTPAPEVGAEVDAQVPGANEIEWRSAESAACGAFVRWRPLVEPIPVGDLFDAEVEIFIDETMRERIEFETVRLDAGMPHHGHGMNVEPTMIRRGAGDYLARGMLMHMPGRWLVYVDLIEDGRLERAQWSMWLSG